MAKKFVYVDPVGDVPAYINPDMIRSIQDGTTEENEKYGKANGTPQQKTVTRITFKDEVEHYVFGKAADLHHKVVDALG